jgi:hypothetical protein
MLGGVVPGWFAEMLHSIKLADHLGDVWDSLITYAPEEWRPWVKAVSLARYDSNDEKYHEG